MSTTEKIFEKNEKFEFLRKKTKRKTKSKIKVIMYKCQVD